MTISATTTNHLFQRPTKVQYYIKVMLSLWRIKSHIPISGKRLPEWLIKDLLEKEKIHEKETFLQGKEVTRAEKIIVPGETVEDFIARKWKKQ